MRKSIRWKFFAVLILLFVLSSALVAYATGSLNPPKRTAAAPAALPMAALGDEGPTQSIMIGTIQGMTVDDPLDRWSGGTITVEGVDVIIPRNMVMELPANRLTLQEFLDDGGPIIGGVASMLTNRLPGGNLVAGDVFLEKGQESIAGIITYIDYDDGYFRINGTPGLDSGGTMVRLNDPESRHTVQSGLGCVGALNCSADPRFTNDPDNYTFTYSTGYPACIPSTTPRTFTEPPLFDVNGNGTFDETGLTAVSAPNGTGDLLCPDSNRDGGPADDSRLFAPIQTGDWATAEGNMEVTGSATFLSAHTIGLGNAMTTSPAANQPDYIVFDEVEWDVAAFANERIRVLFIGFSSLAPSEVDIFALHIDPATGAENEYIVASTVGCEFLSPNDCTAQGIPPFDGDIWKIRYDVDFVVGVPKPQRAPCAVLNNSDLALIGHVSPCPAAPTLADEFGVLMPISRDLIGRSRHSALGDPALLVTLDINGLLVQNGQYLNPVGVGHPEFGEIDLNAIATPFVFAGEPWNLDRRLGPGGCTDDGFGSCVSTTPQPLCPFPFSGIDPKNPSIPGNEDYIFAFHPFALADRLDWPPPVNSPLLDSYIADPTTINWSALCGDNTAPTVAITAPADGATFVDGDSVSLEGTASDLEDVGMSGADITWTSDVVGVLGTGSPLVISTTLSVGMHVITAEVTDSGLLTASDSITVTISAAANTAPTVSITAPATGGIVPIGTAVSFEGTASDLEDVGLSGADITWTSDLDGVLGTGSPLVTSALTTGTHLITASVTDSGFLTASDAITIEITNTAPTVTITAPATGGTVTGGTAVSFEGTASDAEDLGLSGADITWTSDLDGVLGTGSPLVISTLSGGTHLITASVTDSGFLTASDAITITVLNTAPTVTIIAPADGSSFTDVDLVTFTGTASDLEDVGLSGADLVWTSSIDGAMGTGASLSLSNLAIGTHTVTATVTDSGGLTGSASIVVTITSSIPADTVTIIRADFRPSRGEWRVEGTSSSPGPGNTITIYIGSTTGGTVLGTATVDGLGNWRFRVRGSTITPDVSNTISVESTFGGTDLAFPITIN